MVNTILNPLNSDTTYTEVHLY